MDLAFTPIQNKVQKNTMKVIGRMARNQEKENLSGKMEKNTRETLKMTFTMDLVFTPVKKKVQETTMKVIGRMARCQEKENLFSKMEPSKKESLKMMSLNINQSILKLYSYLKRNILI